MPFSVKTRAKFPLLDTFVWYLNERWSVHQKRLKGLPPPWTDDLALQKYRFCQVRREDDRVTRWIHENWLRPHTDDPDLWHAMCVARMFNRISALEAMGWPEPWGRRRTDVLSTMRTLKADGVKIFTSAYTLCGGGYTHGRRGPLIDHHEDALNEMWKFKARIEPRIGSTLQDLYGQLSIRLSFSTFMSGQVVADAKWGGALRNAPDWTTFAVSGPGSARGLNRVCGRPAKITWAGGEVDWHATLLEVRKAILPSLPKSLRDLDAQNIEHGLCELDKWCRVQEGGRPKQTYAIIQPDYCKDVK
jgi:alpha-glutamyl/putrescinyl thymine pyrophosphorylase clade 1